MLPDIGGTELLVIAAVALIVVGPKDLPVLLRKLGQFVGEMRGMANEFRASFDEMARQSELDELRREVQAMREGQYTTPMRDAAGPGQRRRRRPGVRRHRRQPQQRGGQGLAARRLPAGDPAATPRADGRDRLQAGAQARAPAAKDRDRLQAQGRQARAEERPVGPGQAGGAQAR